jgi:hypothetical protein
VQAHRASAKHQHQEAAVTQSDVLDSQVLAKYQVVVHQGRLGVRDSQAQAKHQAGNKLAA